VRPGAIVLAAALSWQVIGCSEGSLDAVALPPGAFDDGLVAHWALDDGSGAVVADSSGNDYAGQLSGGTWIPDGRFGGALRLAAGDSLTVSGFAAATPNWSVSVWIRLSDAQLAADSGLFTEVLSNEVMDSAGWQINIDKRLVQPRFVFSYWAPPLTDYVGTECSCVDTGAWIHLAAVVDVDANLLTLYRNGVVADQMTRPSDILPGDPTLYFGSWNMPGRRLNGDLDDIAIWSRALTAEDIAALFTHTP
jgi:hypothetical protein